MSSKPETKALLICKNTHTCFSQLLQAMILVPMDTRGVTVLRPLSVLGYQDPPCKLCPKSTNSTIMRGCYLTLLFRA